MFLYYLAREPDRVDTDDGVAISEQLQTFQLGGACPEALWPFNPDMLYEAPPPAAWDAARALKAGRWSPLTDDGEVTAAGLRGALAAGSPVIFGLHTFASFESDAVRQGAPLPVPLPGETETQRHCLLAVGYRTDAQGLQILCRNSWGADWGVGGCLWIPDAYFGHRCADGGSTALDGYLLQTLDVAG